MTVDQVSCSHGGSCGNEAIRQFWDVALKRLKTHAELAASQVRPPTVADPGSTREIDGDEKQGG